MWHWQSVWNTVVLPSAVRDWVDKSSGWLSCVVYSSLSCVVLSSVDNSVTRISAAWSCPESLRAATKLSKARDPPRCRWSSSLPTLLWFVTSLCTNHTVRRHYWIFIDDTRQGCIRYTKYYVKDAILQQMWPQTSSNENRRVIDRLIDWLSRV